MPDKQDSRSLSRRDFLKNTTIGASAAGAAVALTATSAQAATPAAGSADAAGYSETEHVRTYYDLARF
ncbi:MAG: ubiquinol-cytochrome c reductase iron-sulfur subunit N-terminal domain-containing protein [Magnetovibrionaceae bacterium]